MVVNKVEKFEGDQNSLSDILDIVQIIKRERQMLEILTELKDVHQSGLPIYISESRNIEYGLTIHPNDPSRSVFYSRRGEHVELHEGIPRIISPGPTIDWNPDLKEFLEVLGASIALRDLLPKTPLPYSELAETYKD